ncbi:hypothetical protein VTJ83DRAFT_3321 [Remersonia thermophila]|uniref:Uncharacterized protein n=1 Tax=Remersonia thermophila TaxID=72144 RepID=A0ABR4DDP5_9PEZI
MAPKQTSKARLSGSGTKSSSSAPTKPPYPFQYAPPALAPFTSTLSPGPLYIAHVDPRPATFKRNLFLVPVALNLAVVAAFVWRVWHIGPYYFALLAAAFGHDTGALPPGPEATATLLSAEGLTWAELGRAILARAGTFMLDFVLAVFVWPWPWEFAVGSGGRGSPLRWRLAVGFRGDEVYVRRSREGVDKLVGEHLKKTGGGVDLLDADAKAAKEARQALVNRVRAATAPLLMQQKTGYLLMDGDWDLDWRAMVNATKLADKKEIGLGDLGMGVALLHHDKFGWLTVDFGAGDATEQDKRRRQVFAFRDALAKLGKEDLFFRWIEMVQFETSQPGGFTPDRQIKAAQKIREMFQEHGIDFDGLWKAAVGTDDLGM